MLAERIGSAELAEMSAHGASRATTLRGSDLPRLSEIVARGPGVPEQPLDAEIAFRKGPEAGPVVHIRVHGELQLTCQRCFAPVGWPLDVDVALTAVASEDEAGELADPFDSIVLDEDGGLPLRAAVEDEILAALPLAPVHAERAVCAGGAAAAVQPAAVAAVDVNRPFAGLDALLGRRGRES